MSKTVETALTEGLQRGYLGHSIRRTSKGGVPGKSSDVYLPSGAHYHDHWFGQTSSAGQETVIIGNEVYSRSYAGGIISAKSLADLKITPIDIHAFLERQITTLGSKTRLHKRCFPPTEGDWKYEYNIDSRLGDPEITTATENILYGSGSRTLVFRHNFILVPIR